MKFYLFITANNSVPKVPNQLVREIVGMDIAYETYDKACELADMLNLDVFLIVADTGEIINSNRFEE